MVPTSSDVAWQTVTQLAERWRRDPDGWSGLASEASRAGYEATHLAKVFREVVGVPPAAFVRRMKLERAALQLEQPDTTVLSAALTAGYGSGEAFTRAFRRRFGRSPSAFRAGAGRSQPRSPPRCPAALDWAEATIVDRGFVGWGTDTAPDPEAMGAAMARVALPDGPTFSLGVLSQPWGWSHEDGVPSFQAVQLTERRPVRAPLLPVWIPARRWLRVLWTGGAYEVAPAVFWMHDHGLESRGERAGFAPTLTLLEGASGSGTQVWVPLWSRR